MKKILFICLGNICRSPTAETIMQALVDEHGLSDQFHIDSCGTAAYHVGHKADSRMSKHCSARGYNITSLARQFDPENDFDEFDFILVADDSNLSDVLSTTNNKQHHKKVAKMTDHCDQLDYDHVPDPYYSGAEGFELVIDILEDACTGLLKTIKA